MEQEISVAKVLELSEKYTSRQLHIILDNDFDAENNKRELIWLYDKAIKNEDDFVISILLNKYDMIKIINFDEIGLPESTQEEADAEFKKMYEMIKKIAPPKEIDKTKNRNKNRKEGIKRRYGGLTFCRCFTFDKGYPIFHYRKYLFMTKSDNVRKLAISLNCPKNILNGIITDLIEWCVIQPKIKENIIKLLETFPDAYSVPLEDVLEMKCGNIKLEI